MNTSKGSIVMGMMSFFALIVLSILGLMSGLFGNIFDDVKHVFVTKKPLVFEKEDFILKVNYYPDSLLHEYNSKNIPLHLNFGEKYASIFACGDGSGDTFSVEAEYYNDVFKDDSQFSPSILDLIYRNDIERVNFGNNEYLHIITDPSVQTYFYLDQSVVVKFQLYPIVCGGAYGISELEKAKILTEFEFIRKIDEEPEVFKAYNKFIDKKNSGEITTPTECFLKSDQDNLSEQKICVNYFEAIYDYMQAEPYSEFFKKNSKVYDEQSCKEFIKNFSPAEQDVLISEFSHVGTLSTCASVIYWDKNI